MSKKEIKTIRVCDDCGTPLIWTFVFDHCERYCLNCGAKGGMLGTGTDVPATRELRFQEKMVKKIWSVIYSNEGLEPISGWRVGCKKCETEKRHHNHLSEAEKENDQIARDYLQRVKGIFTKPKHDGG
jgi:hypothetical protein